MSDIGPHTDTIEREPPIARERDEVLEARRAVTISRGVSTPLNLAQQLEVAQTMAKAGAVIPAHLRGSPGACLAIIEYAHHWGMLTYGVANKSYVVNDRLCFESQLIHAVIELNAPLYEDNLNFRFEGDGAKMKCLIWANCLIRGKVKKLEWWSPEFDLIEPKKSPLWKHKPQLQLFYNTSRDWARVFFPHIILGAITQDEAAGIESDEARAAAAKDVTPIKTMVGNGGPEGEGWRPGVVESGLMGSPDELENVATDVEVKPAAPEDPPAAAERKPRATRKTNAAAAAADAMRDDGAPAAIVRKPDSTEAVPPSNTEPASPGGSPPAATSTPPHESHGSSGSEQKDAASDPAATTAKAPDAPVPPSSERPVQEAQPRPDEPTAAPPVEVSASSIKSPEAFVEYCIAWMEKILREGGTEAMLMRRWVGEEKDRGRCAVIGPEFARLKAVRIRIVAELNKGQNP